MRNNARRNNQYGTVYDIPNLDTNAFRQAAMRDPRFAWGELLGSALSGLYAQNYNNRGISKAVDKALETYGINPVENDQAALQQVQQNMAVQPGVGVGMSSDMDALNNVRQNMGLEAVQPAGPSISAGELPAQDNQQVVSQLAQMPGAGIMAQENAARSMGNFDMNTALANAKRQMIRDGRTPYQIEMAMEQLQPHFQKMQDDSYRVRAERIMAELGQGNISDADYKKRIIELAQMGDYGKNAANVYGRDIVTGQQRWNAQQMADKQDRQYRQQIALKDMDAARQIAVARERAKLYNTIGNGGNRGLFGSRTTGNTVKSPLDSAEFKYIDTAINKITEIPAEDRTPEQNKFYDQYKGLRDQIMAQSIGNQFNYHTPEERGANATSNQTGFNPNNYDQAVPFFREFAKRGNYNKGDIAKYIRHKYGLKPDDTSNEFVESIIREI